MYSCVFCLCVFAGVLGSSAHREFTTTPENVTQAESLYAEFHCQHPTTNFFISWLKNDEYISNNLPDNTRQESQQARDGTLHTLAVLANSVYNGSQFRCSASNNDGSIVLRTANVTLRVQGPLDSVSNLTSTSTNNSITITWDPPFSLDLTTADPDIAYCVDVFNITSDGQREMIASDCSVLQPQYIFTVDSPDPSDLFEFTVTPRSNVEGAKNGTTSKSLHGSFLRAPDPPRDVNIDVEFNPLNITVTIPNSNTDFGQPVQVDDYTITLKPIDGLGEIPEPILIRTVYEEDKTELVITDPSLIGEHRLCLIRIHATNTAGTSTSQDIELSTHDVQKIKVLNCNPGQVRVRSLFADGSNATGYLAIVQSLDNVNDISYRFAQRKSGIPQINTTVDGLNGLHNVTIFDVDENGLPHNHPAGLPRTIGIEWTTDNSTEQSPMNPTSIAEVWSSLDSNEVCISCIFPDNSTTSCVSIILSVNGHMTSPYGLLNITVNEQRACDCIPLPPDDYHVAVFARQLNGTMITATPIKVAFVTVSNKPATKPTKPKPKPKANTASIASCRSILDYILIVAVSAVCWWFA